MECGKRVTPVLANVKVSTSNPKENEMSKWLIALMVGCLSLTAHPRELIRVLEDEAEVIGAGTCKVQEVPFDCVRLQHGGNTYTVLGTIKGDEFFAQYILKLYGDEWQVVWSFKGST